MSTTSVVQIPSTKIGPQRPFLDALFQAPLRGSRIFRPPALPEVSDKRGINNDTVAEVVKEALRVNA